MNLRCKRIGQVLMVVLSILASAWVLRQSVGGSCAARVDIYEAALRHLFANSHSSLLGHVYFYFVATDQGGDPSGELLRRFEGQIPYVLPVSHSYGPGLGGVARMPTREEGILFTVGKLKMVSRREARVEGGYHESGRSAAGYTITLERSPQGWAVVQMVLKWMA